MNILYCAYRDWALQILESLQTNFVQHNFDLLTDKSDLEGTLEKRRYDLILFVGWSWYVEKNIIEEYYCVCLHPSPLPKYRGGSPIQNQILSGETEGAVTLFRMDDLVDHGPIIFQEEISLTGTLDEIFSEISQVGKLGIELLIDNFPNVSLTPQNEDDASYYSRRTPASSEITQSELMNMSSLQLHNKIRCLQSPYPLPFFVCADGKRLYIKETILEN